VAGSQIKGMGENLLRVDKLGERASKVGKKNVQKQTKKNI